MRLKIAAALALAAAPSLHAQSLPAQAPPPAPDPAGATPVSGTWSYSNGPASTVARFVSATGQPQLTVSCLRSARQLVIAKPASTAAPFMLLWTSSTTKSYPASFDPATGVVSVRLAASDAMLDAIVFSRARFAVTLTGSPQLVLPNEPELTRVIEDCRA
ncbi:MAG TPA: hypothetical protein VJL90_00100 [Pseudorhodoplanes sp.]|nr:hypothetical protein [Pseudorhodoplanes sp.]